MTARILLSHQNVELFHTLSQELDRTIRENLGKTLTPELAESTMERARQAGSRIADPESVSQALDFVASQLGLQALRGATGVDASQAKRNLGSMEPIALGLPVTADVAQFQQEQGLRSTALPLLDELSAPGKGFATRIDQALVEATRTLETALSKVPSDYARASVQTAQIQVQIPGALDELKEKAWSLYQDAKGSISQEDYGLARDQLNLAGALLAKMHLAARATGDEKALNVAENRIGMVLHQHGQIAKALGRTEEQRSFDIKALSHYWKVLTKEEIADPPYHPAAHYNAACAFVQLGNPGEANAAFSAMLRTCGSDEQREMMRGVARNDKELQRDFANDPGYRELIGK